MRGMLRRWVLSFSFLLRFGSFIVMFLIMVRERGIISFLALLCEVVALLLLGADLLYLISNGELEDDILISKGAKEALSK